jgi:hypothetical protein
MVFKMRIATALTGLAMTGFFNSLKSPPKGGLFI